MPRSTSLKRRPISCWPDSVNQSCAISAISVLIDRWCRNGIDVMLGCVEIITGLRVDAPHHTDHFRAEQDVLRIDHVSSHVHAPLMRNAGNKKRVRLQVSGEIGLLKHICQATISSPMPGSAVALGNDEP